MEKYPVVYLAAAIEHLLKNRQRRMMSKSGLHKGHGKIVVLLYGLGPQSQASIARHLQISPATVTLTIQRLEKGGYVRRKMDEVTKRAQITELTEKGEEFARQAVDAWIAINDDTTLGFSDEEKDTLSSLLCRVRDNLSDKPMDSFDDFVTRIFNENPSKGARQ